MWEWGKVWLSCSFKLGNSTGPKACFTATKAGVGSFRWFLWAELVPAQGPLGKIYKGGCTLGPDLFSSSELAILTTCSLCPYTGHAALKSLLLLVPTMRPFVLCVVWLAGRTCPRPIPEPPDGPKDIRQLVFLPKASFCCSAVRLLPLFDIISFKIHAESIPSHSTEHVIVGFGVQFCHHLGFCHL